MRTHAQGPRRSLAGFDATPGPNGSAAKRVVTALITDLTEQRAVDGASGEVLDALIDSWLARWRQQLVPQTTGQQAALSRRIGRARNRLAAAQGRMGATQRAHDSARAAYTQTSAPAAGVTERQVSNGVRTAASH